MENQITPEEKKLWLDYQMEAFKTLLNQMPSLFFNKAYEDANEFVAAMCAKYADAMLSEAKKRGCV